MRLNELRDTSYEIAKSKGWHDPEFDTATFADRMALVSTELAEALEEHRKGHAAGHVYFPDAYSDANIVLTMELRNSGSRHNLAEAGYKPEGVIIELADAMIRIGDCAGKHEIDLESTAGFDETGLGTVESLVDLPATDEPPEPSFGAWMCRVLHSLALAAMYPDTHQDARQFFLISSAVRLGEMVRWLGITPEEFVAAIELKHTFNRTRLFRHGGKKL